MFYEVVPTKKFRDGVGGLTYVSEEKLEPGQIVRIPLGKTEATGIVLKKVEKPEFRCKPISKILYKTPLPRHLLKAIEWMGKYYLAPLPTVVAMILPKGVEKTRRGARANLGFEAEDNNIEQIKLNPAQKRALEEIKESKSQTKLLFGVTGSGKTNIYMQLAKETLANEKSVILLVPEIALTSQLVQVFEGTFKKNAVLMHSRQTEAERHKIWEEVLLSREPQVIIGPRSALLAPVRDLGLIIIDEAHEATYFQENVPKYSSLRLASFMATTLKTPAIFGTATPLVADFYLAKERGAMIKLTEKAKQTAVKPEVKIVDFAKRENFLKSRYFSDALLGDITENLENGWQTLIYHNRRGSAPMTICEECGWQAECPHCFLPLTLHVDTFNLVCHTCGFYTKIPKGCPDCGAPSILHKGFGTKLLETELNKIFTQARIVRFDADNKKGETLDARFDEVRNGEFDIIIGTQTVSRGLDLPKLASIGIVQADAGLALPDFSAEEKTFELLTQVIGRVGRGHLPKAKVMIQTFKPEAEVINFALKADYLGFYECMIKKRQWQGMPPFKYLAKVSVTYKTEKTTLQKIRQLARDMAQVAIQANLCSLEISPAMPSFHERTTAGFTWQIIIKAKKRAELLQLLGHFPHLSATLDPPSLL